MGTITRINIMTDIKTQMETIIIKGEVIMAILPKIDFIPTDSNLKGDITMAKGNNRIIAWINVSLAWQRCVAAV